MKKYLVIISIIIIVFVVGIVIYNKVRDSELNNKNTKGVSNIEGINTALTLDDDIEDNTIWCGTFQLIWNDLKNDLAKQDIVFTPQIQEVENLNKETFTIDDLSEKYYYKKMGLASLQLKEEIEKAIKEKFNETSDILDDFDWNSVGKDNYFLYVMLKKDFEFKKEFEELEKGKFSDYENIEYFGIGKNNENDEVRYQVTVLYYNSKDDFAIKVATKQKDEVIFCKNPKGNTFNEIYDNIVKQKENYNGNTELEKGEELKIPNIKIKNKEEFTQIENKEFSFLDGRVYRIEKAIQTIDFELNRKGGKIKSEAGMMLEKLAVMTPDEPRTFAIDDTFAMFLIEEGKDNPYFAAKVNDITKFQ